MEDSADIELYEEIVGNPAYSSSSDICESDQVSFQFREPRQTECREEDIFARARSRPDSIIVWRQQCDSATLALPSAQYHVTYTHYIVRQWRPTRGPL